MAETFEQHTWTELVREIRSGGPGFHQAVARLHALAGTLEPGSVRTEETGTVASKKARIEAQAWAAATDAGRWEIMGSRSRGNLSGSAGNAGRHRKPGKSDISPGGRRQIARIEAAVKAGKISKSAAASAIKKIS